MFITRVLVTLAAIGTAAVLVPATAQASTYYWVRQTLRTPNCTVQQAIWENWQGASHEYQQGILIGGSGCYASITQTKNGVVDGVDGFAQRSTKVFYDGPGFTNSVCVWEPAAPIDNNYHCSDDY